MPKRRRNNPVTSGNYNQQQYYLLRNPLAAGRWMHFIYYWRGGFTMDNTQFTSGVFYTPTNGNPYRRLLINGIGHSAAGVALGANTPTHDIAYSNCQYFNSGAFPCPEFDWSWHVMGQANCGCMFGPDQHGGPPIGTCANLEGMGAPTPYQKAYRNLIRIGENDKWADASIPTLDPGAASDSNFWTAPQKMLPAQGFPPATRNYAPDSTMDEYYFLRDTFGAATSGQDGQANSMKAIFANGRYHIPMNAGEGLYESPKFNLLTAGGTAPRQLPPPSAAPPPSGYTNPAPPPVGAGAGSGMKVIGVNWTWFGEDVDTTVATLDPTMTDYSTQTAATPSVIKPTLSISLNIDGVWTPTYTNEWFSPVLTPSGTPWPVISANNLQFRAKFGFALSIPASAFVLATPYMDDITIYYDRGDSGFVDYHMS